VLLERFRSLPAELDYTFELLISDNCSTDDTPGVVQGAQGWLPQLRYIRQATLLPIGLSFVAALRAGRGEWCLYLADDDAVDLVALQELLHWVSGQPNLAACFCDWVSYDDGKGRELERYFSGLQLTEPVLFRRGAPVAPIQIVELLVKRWVYPEIGLIRRTCLKHAVFPMEDAYPFYVWLLGLLRQGDVALHPRVYYRENRLLRPSLQRASWGGQDYSPKFGAGLRQAAQLCFAAGLKAAGAYPTGKENVDSIHLLVGLASTARQTVTVKQQAVLNRAFRLAVESNHAIRVYSPQEADVGQPFSTVALLVLAAFDSACHAAHGLPGCQEVMVCGFDNDDILVAATQQWPALRFVQVSPEALPVAKTTQFIVFPRAADRVAALAAGHAHPSRSLAIDHLVVAIDGLAERHVLNIQ
jgi:hypothetical protein